MNSGRDVSLWRHKFRFFLSFPETGEKSQGIYKRTGGGGRRRRESKVDRKKTKKKREKKKKKKKTKKRRGGVQFALPEH